MKKFSKIVALSMALAMTLGMTVCAEVSPGTINTWVDKAGTPTATNSQGEPVEVSIREPEGGETVVNAVSNEIEAENSTLKTQIVEAAADAITIEAGAQVDVDLVFILDITPSQSGTISIEIPYQVEDTKENETYVLMHQGTSGWEPVEGAKVENGVIKFTRSDYSNYALFLVTVAEVAPTPTPTPIVGDPVTNEQQSSQTGSQSSQSSSQSSQSSSQSSQSSSQSSQTASQTTQTASQTTQTTNETVAPTSTPVSPKTGETVPTAVFATMILLAGAAVCAKRAQLNH